ncbi:hypothetical protein MLD38_001380 [Melastoma candidum]|nr:hypothetical protein MLD38_001380 [Melastoma candidum]
MLDQRSVLCDLPVTLTSLLTLPTWTIIAERFTAALFASVERIHSWVMRSSQREVNSSGQHEDVNESERGSAPFLLGVMRESCILLRDYLPLDKQFRLVNMAVSSTT